MFPAAPNKTVACLVISALAPQTSTIFVVRRVSQFFAFLCFSLVILLPLFFAVICLIDFAVYDGPQAGAETLCGVPKVHEGRDVPHGEKHACYNKLHSGVSYSAVGHEFSVNASAVYISSGVFKQKHT